MIRWDYEVAVIGAGAAGLFAAMRAAESGAQTVLIEKNPRPGVKILMSGGTRCNLTHATDHHGIVVAFGERSQGRFLHSALAALSPEQLIAVVEAEGCATKREETGKVFPVSNRAADVLSAILKRVHRSGCRIEYASAVQGISKVAASSTDEPGFRIELANGTLVHALRVVLTTGGQSYPGCGTTGDGYRLASSLGHSIVPVVPALVPLTVAESWVPGLSGITLPDVTISIWNAPQTDARTPRAEPARELDSRRGSVLLTHFGLSGPCVLDLSRCVTQYTGGMPLHARCDFLPDTPAAELETRFKRLATEQPRSLVLTAFPEAIPRRLAEQLLQLAEIPAEQRLADLRREDRMRLLRLLKLTPLTVTGSRGFAKAEVTAGGVPLGEVSSKTLQSRVTTGLYLAGELLDLDGPIGGYNFQAAFSTGWLAGESAAASLNG